MYVGGEASAPAVRLNNLHWLILGYQLALADVAPDDPDRTLLQDFARYLNQRFSWSAAAGAIHAIEKANESPQRAWEAFWDLLDEYLAFRSPPATY